MYYLVIRPARDDDRPQRDELIRAELATLRRPAFFLFLFQEVTLQAVVLCAAALFILCGASAATCALLVPAAAAAVYLLVLLGHASLAEKHIQESRKELLGMVGELYSELGAPLPAGGAATHIALAISGDAAPPNKHNMHKQLVCTASVSELWGPAPDAGWLHAVAFRDPCVYASCGAALVDGAAAAAAAAQLTRLAAVTSDVQAQLRDALYDAGFVWRGQYHRRLLGGALSLALTQHARDLAL